jgi:hypothetical protein
LNFTVLDPCVVPKFVPAMVTVIPAAPTVCDRLVILGVGFTVKLFPLLARPNAVTTTFPVVAPLGAGALIWVALQLVGAVAVPLNVTALVP